jgi:hypothetical protein
VYPSDAIYTSYEEAYNAFKSQGIKNGYGFVLKDSHPRNSAIRTRYYFNCDRFRIYHSVATTQSQAINASVNVSIPSSLPSTTTVSLSIPAPGSPPRPLAPFPQSRGASPISVTVSIPGTSSPRPASPTSFSVSVTVGQSPKQARPSQDSPEQLQTQPVWKPPTLEEFLADVAPR